MPFPSFLIWFGSFFMCSLNYFGSGIFNLVKQGCDLTKRVIFRFYYKLNY